MQCHASASEDSFSLYLDHVLGVANKKHSKMEVDSTVEIDTLYYSLNH